MKFDKRDLHIIRIAIIKRCYELDELINHSNDEITRNFFIKERKDNFDILRKIDF